MPEPVPNPVTNKVIKLPTLKVKANDLKSHLKNLSNKPITPPKEKKQTKSSLDKVYVQRKDTANRMWKEAPRKSKIDQVVSIPSLSPLNHACMSPVSKTARTKP